MKFAHLSPAVCLSFLVLAGCSMAGPDPRAANTTTPAGVPIVDSIPADGKVISDINIELCQATSADKPHTVDEAMLALKAAGKRAGASGIANVTSSIVSVPTAKCFSMAQATGIAYRQG
jgi:hypothetical protein